MGKAALPKQAYAGLRATRNEQAATAGGCRERTQ